MRGWMFVTAMCLLSGLASAQEADLPTTRKTISPDELTSAPIVLKPIAELLKTKPDGLAPVPPDAELQAARRDVKKQFSQQSSAARTPEAKSQLAVDVYNTSVDEKSKAVEYALLERSVELGVAARDWRFACWVLSQMGKVFDVDVLPMKAEAISDCTALSKTPGGAWKLARGWSALAKEAIARDDFELAARCVDKADAAARKSEDDVLKEQMAQRRGDVKDLAEAYAEAKSAKETLQKDPQDAAAALTWGRFVCLTKADMTRGLPFMAHGEGPLAELAKREAGSQLAPDQVKLGDDWAKLADSETDAKAKRVMKMWAATHYRAARAGVPENEQRALDVKAIAIESEYPVLPVGKWVSVLPLINLKAGTTGGKWRWEGESAINEPGKMAGLAIPIELDGSYDVQIRFSRREGSDMVQSFYPFGVSKFQVTLCNILAGVHGIYQQTGAGVDGKKHYVRPGDLKNNYVYTMFVKVVRDGNNGSIDVALDGAPLLHWDGPITNFLRNDGDSLFDRGLLLVSRNVVVRYDDVSIRVHSGTVRHSLPRTTH
ncbi:MAG TPA: hypothetical protein VGE52_09800 [Pirellulales bacterium]